MPEPDNKKRVAIRCHNAPPCGRDYTLLREFGGDASFFVACPYCGAAAVVDLDPYRSPERVIYAGEEARPFTLSALALPDVLPSRPPRPDETAGQQPEAGQ